MKQTFEEMEPKRFAWSLKTFPEATALGSLKKARIEVMEAIDELIKFVAGNSAKEKLAEEYVDAIMCIFDSAARAGIFIADLQDAFALKFEKNKGREWKDNGEGNYSHVKEGQNG